jgi:hypothetical protein
MRGLPAGDELAELFEAWSLGGGGRVCTEQCEQIKLMRLDSNHCQAQGAWTGTGGQLLPLALIFLGYFLLFFSSLLSLYFICHRCELVARAVGSSAENVSW